MLGFGALGEFALGETGSNTLALTSDILREVVTLLVDEKHLPGLPKQLHHFTSLETAYRIIEGDNVRLSHAEYSNDQTEMAQAKEIIRDELAKRSGSPFFAQVLSEYERLAPNLDAYIFCMCMDKAGSGQPQDILSQWRAYGQDGRGACLTLIAGDLALLVSNTPGLRINPVMYERSIQRRFINEILDRGNVAHASAAPKALDATVAALVFATPLMKAPGFEEEREWRLIFMPPQDAPAPKLHFQSRRDFLGPYLELQHLWNDLRLKMIAIPALKATLPTPAVSAHVPPLIPISELMVGPSGHQVLNVRAFEKLRSQTGRSSVVIRSSEIPYRSLS